METVGLQSHLVADPFIHITLYIPMEFLFYAVWVWQMGTPAQLNNIMVYVWNGKEPI